MNNDINFDYKVLISGNYNVFDEGWNGAGVYMASGLYESSVFKVPVYIGSSINLQERIERGHISYLKRNTHMNNIFQIAWNKRGDGSFVWFLLEGCDKSKTYDIEQKYLDFYRPFADEFGGFNISHDAKSSNKGIKLTKETKEKISRGKNFFKKSILQFSKNGNFIKEYESMCDAAKVNNFNRTRIKKCCRGKCPSAYNFIWRYKNGPFSDIPVKANNATTVIKQFDKNGNFLQQFDSIRNAAVITGISYRILCHAAQGQQVMGGDFFWRYENELLESRPIKSQVIKAIIQCDANGNVIQEFETVTQASKDTGINISCISEAATGKQKTAGGYYWIFKSNYNKNE